MNEDRLDQVARLSSALSKMLTGLLVLYTLGTGIYKGIESHTTSGLMSFTAAGFVGALLVAFSYLAIDFGLNVWDRSTGWLSRFIRRYPYARLWLVLPGMLFAIYAAYLALRFLQADLSLRIFLSIYLLWIFPAALSSLVSDDLLRERRPLSKEISRDTRIGNPQAAVENAFTHFESRLSQRAGGNTKLYGSRLIDAAYGGSSSKLVYEADGMDRTAHLHSFMAGAYSLLRNPRHHRIVDDDEQKVQAIISVVELLVEFVELSEDRDILHKTPG